MTMMQLQGEQMKLLAEEAAHLRTEVEGTRPRRRQRTRRCLRQPSSFS